MKMSRPLDIGIGQIKTLILKMGKLSEDSLTLAMKGFLEKEDVYVQTRAWSNTLLMLSEEVEDRATELIALHQPMAGDLRTLKSYIKIAYDLERYGRYAMDISDLLERLGDWGDIPEDLRIKEMGECVKEVVETANDMMEKEDESLLLEISKIESRIDDLYIESLNLLAEEKDCKTKTIIACLLTVRYLERIADHSSYIAEAIGYAITGKRISFR
jgi:phosphate transport system protein